eukprot:6470100-Amphidinium_carterae.1
MHSTCIYYTTEYFCGPRADAVTHEGVNSERWLGRTEWKVSIAQCTHMAALQQSQYVALLPGVCPLHRLRRQCFRRENESSTPRSGHDRYMVLVKLCCHKQQSNLKVT